MAAMPKAPAGVLMARMWGDLGEPASSFCHFNVPERLTRTFRGPIEAGLHEATDAVHGLGFASARFEGPWSNRFDNGYTTVPVRCIY